MFIFKSAFNVMSNLHLIPDNLSNLNKSFKGLAIDSLHINKKYKLYSIILLIGLILTGLSFFLLSITSVPVSAVGCIGFVGIVCIFFAGYMLLKYIMDHRREIRLKNKVLSDATNSLSNTTFRKISIEDGEAIFKKLPKIKTRALYSFLTSSLFESESEESDDDSDSVHASLDDEQLYQKVLCGDPLVFKNIPQCVLKKTLSGPHISHVIKNYSHLETIAQPLFNTFLKELIKLDNIFLKASNLGDSFLDNIKKFFGIFPKDSFWKSIHSLFTVPYLGNVLFEKMLSELSNSRSSDVQNTMIYRLLKVLVRLKENSAFHNFQHLDEYDLDYKKEHKEIEEDMFFAKIVKGFNALFSGWLLHEDTKLFVINHLQKLCLDAFTDSDEGEQFLNQCLEYLEEGNILTCFIELIELRQPGIKGEITVYPEFIKFRDIDRFKPIIRKGHCKWLEVCESVIVGRDDDFFTITDIDYLLTREFVNRIIDESYLDVGLNEKDDFSVNPKLKIEIEEMMDCLDKHCPDTASLGLVLQGYGLYQLRNKAIDLSSIFKIVMLSLQSKSRRIKSAYFDFKKSNFTDEIQNSPDLNLHSFLVHNRDSRLAAPLPHHQEQIAIFKMLIDSMNTHPRAVRRFRSFMNSLGKNSLEALTVVLNLCLKGIFDRGHFAGCNLVEECLIRYIPDLHCREDVKNALDQINAIQLLFPSFYKT